MRMSCSFHSIKSLCGRVALLGFALCAAVSLAHASSCGINWGTPSNFFDGVNAQGEFSYWRDIGQVDFGNDLKIPLVIGFKPNRGSHSLLGRGFMVPLLESNVVQVDERRFLVFQPDGLTRRFKRKTPTDSILAGQGGWAGEIKGDTMTLWAECGSKLVFVKGRIVTIGLPKDRTLEVVYVDGLVSEVREKGRTVLKVERDFRGNVMGLRVGNNRVGVEMGQRPRVDVVAKTNVIGGLEPSVQALTLADGKQVVFEFAVNEKVQPTLDVSGDKPRSFTWDAATGRLLRDGDWNYSIKPGKNRWANAAIGRVNGQKQKEFWHDDKHNGLLIVEGVDGVRHVTHTFVSGVLTGKVRKKERIVKGKSEMILQAFYDETGKLLRLDEEGKELRTYNYDEKGRLVGVLSGGKELWSKKFDEKGRVVEEVKKHGAHVVYQYLEDGRVEKKVSESNGSKLTQLYHRGKEIRRELSGGRVFNYSYDDKGRLIRVVDQNHLVRDILVRDIVYGVTGEVIEEYRDGVLSYKNFIDKNSAGRIKVFFDPNGSIKMAQDFTQEKVKTLKNISADMLHAQWLPMN